MRVCEIEKSFGDTQILNKTTVAFEKTGMVFLIGRSGCGKSTFLNILGKIDSADAGEVVFGNGKKETDEILRRDYLSYVFQEFNLLNQKTVKENLEIALSIARIPYDEDRVKNVLLDLRVWELRDKPVVLLSGGEKQRVAIARAVLKDSKVVLADEPTGNLDEENAYACMDMLKAISKRSLVIVVTHDLTMAKRYADRIYEIREKKLHLLEDCGYEKNSDLPIFREDGKEKEGGWVLSYTLDRWKESRNKAQILLVMTLVLFSLAIVLGTYSATKQMVSQVNSSLLENDYFVMHLSQEDEQNRKEKIEGLLHVLQNEENVLEYIPFCESGYMYQISEEERSSIQPIVIRDNDFFAKRYSDLVGRVPKSLDEVIVNENFARILMPLKEAEDAIGKSIVLWINGEERTLRISGVRTREESREDVFLLYILEETASYYEQKKYRTTEFSVNGITYDVQCDVAGEQELFAGRMPTAKGEIAVDYSLFESVYSAVLSAQGKYPTEEEMEDITESERIRFLLDTKVTISGVLSQELLCSIVGVVQGGEKQTFLVSSEYVESCSDCKDRVDVYVKSIETHKMQHLEKEISRFDETLEPVALRTTKIIGSRFVIFTYLMAFVTTILIVIAIVMTMFFSKSSIEQRNYEVGVIKALGASSKEVYRLLILGNMLDTIVSVLVAIVLVVLLDLTGILSHLQSGGVSMYLFEWWHVLVVVAVGFLVSYLASARSIHETAKVEIIESIRKKMF